MKFIHAKAGYPGSILDAHVLQLTGLFDMAENQQILFGPTQTINDVEIGPPFGRR